MVIYLQGTNAQVSADLSKLAKLMVNLATGKEWFDDEYNLITSGESPKNFNTFTHQTVEFNILPKMGNILMYLDNDVDANSVSNDEIKNQLEWELKNLGQFPRENTIVSMPYTMYVETCELTHKIIMQNAKPNMQFHPNTAFTWYLYILRPETENYPMHLNLTYDHMQLVKSECRDVISIIIYDAVNLFTMPKKQLEIPKITQLSLHHAGRVITDTIGVDNKFGLEFEFLKAFYPTVTQSICDKTKASLWIGSWDVKPLNASIVKKVNPKMPWQQQLMEKCSTSDLLKNRENSNFRDDICFITKMPLSTVVVQLIVRNADNHIFAIFISPAVYFSIFTSNMMKMGINEYIHTQCKIMVENTVFMKYPRSALDVINMLPKTVDPVKKNLYLAIETYGIFMVEYNRFYAVVDPKNQDIYLGLPKIYERDVLDAQKTQNILFHIDTRPKLII